MRGNKVAILESAEFCASTVSVSFSNVWNLCAFCAFLWPIFFLPPSPECSGATGGLEKFCGRSGALEAGDAFNVVGLREEIDRLRADQFVEPAFA